MTSTPVPPVPPPFPSPDTAPRLTVRSPADLLAAVPYLLGFHPEESLVVVVLGSQRLVFATRSDLPALGVPADQIEAIAEYTASVVAQQGGDAAVIIGYGATEPVRAAVPALQAALSGEGLEIVDVLRVQDGRYWCCLCDDPECCPPAGTPYDPAASAVAAAATYAGQLALPDRAALVGQVAPVDGTARESMRQATLRAGQRLPSVLDAAPTDDGLVGVQGAKPPALDDFGSARLPPRCDPESSPEVTGRRPLVEFGGPALRAAGEAAVAALLDLGRAGTRPTDDQVAWVTLLLTHVPVRDFAWRRIRGDDWELDLLGDIVRRAEPDLVPAPASLLAFAAWRAGRGALANVALDRALSEDPEYSMALLLRDCLAQGMPPSVLESWPSPAPGRQRVSRAPGRGRVSRARGR